MISVNILIAYILVGLLVDALFKPTRPPTRLIVLWLPLAVKIGFVSLIDLIKYYFRQKKQDKALMKAYAKIRAKEPPEN